MADIPEIMKGLKDERPSFNYSEATLHERKYVAWIDIMGSKSTLSISDVKAAIFIGRLHSCILKSRDICAFTGNIYPFVDGVYITCADRSDIQKFMKCIFRLMSIVFLFEDYQENKYMVRGSISFGQVIEGADIKKCADLFDQNEQYTSGVLFGTPLALSYISEKYAAPFGIWIEDTARHSCPPDGKTIRRTFWSWWTYPTEQPEIDIHCDQIEKLLAEELHNYFDWCSRNSCRILYGQEAIARHRARAEQYFPSWPRR